MRAVSIIIVATCRSTDERHVPINVQIRVSQVDAGVDNGDVRIHALVNAVNLGGGRDVRADAADAGGNSLAEGLHFNILLDEVNARIISQRVQSPCGNMSSETIQCMRVPVSGDEAML